MQIKINTNELALKKSIRDMIDWCAGEFELNGIFLGHGTDNAYDEALALVLHVIGKDYSIAESYLDSGITDAEKKRVTELASRRIQTRKPLAYLTGVAYFAGLDFLVNEQVLVPRSPIAELIASSYFPWVEPENVHAVLDLCTGSGCIGIASAVALPQAKVVLSDISADAIEVASKNIHRHNLNSRVSVIKSDVFDDIPAQKFDLIVSNPPYVSEAEYEDLPAEYQNEPKLGLTSGHDGMEVVARILKQAPAFLSTSGIIIIEVGASAELLMQRYPQVPFNWIEFEYGGDGVFTLTKQELEQYQQAF